MNRYFGKRLYSVLSSVGTRGEADKLAKDWREEGFPIRITRGVKGRYIVWKGIVRSAEVVRERRKTYRSSKRG